MSGEFHLGFSSGNHFLAFFPVWKTKEGGGGGGNVEFIGNIESTRFVCLSGVLTPHKCPLLPIFKLK